MREVVVVEYDPHWPDLFTEEAAGLRQAFGASLTRLEHIGSTAVPGLAAKPIVDIQAVVQSVSDVEAAVPALSALGWEQGLFNLDAKRHLYFKKQDAYGTRTHQLHVYEPDHPAAAAHLLFRDYLRVHSDEAERYGELKRRLAQQHRYDGLAYCDAKTVFVQAVVAKARGLKDG